MVIIGLDSSDEVFFYFNKRTNWCFTLLMTMVEEYTLEEERRRKLELKLKREVDVKKESVFLNSIEEIEIDQENERE